MINIKNSILVGFGSMLLSLLPQSQAEAQNKSAVIHNEFGFAMTSDFYQPKYPNPDSEALEVSSGRVSTSDTKQHFTMSAAPGNSALIKHNATDFCLDSTNNLAVNQNVIVWRCDENNPNQQWQFKAITNDKYLINRRNTNLCINITSGDGTVMSDCNSENPSQLFSTNPYPLNPYLTWINQKKYLKVEKIKLI